MVIYEISRFPFPSDAVLSGVMSLVILIFLTGYWGKFKKNKKV